MPKKKAIPLATRNKILALQNSTIRAENKTMKMQRDLRLSEIQNGLSNLVTGAQSQTALTSFIPALQNNMGSDFERPINKDITETICDIYDVGDGTVTI